MSLDHNMPNPSNVDMSDMTDREKAFLFIDYLTEEINNLEHKDWMKGVIAAYVMKEMDISMMDATEHVNKWWAGKFTSADAKID